MPIVLFADDEQEIVDIFKNELKEQEGATIEVISVNSGTAAIAAIKNLGNSGQQPDAVFLDINMDGGGIQAAAAIQEICPMADKVFVTAYRNQDIELEVEKAGIRTQWIDKDRYWLERTVRFARDAVTRRRLSVFHLRIREWADTEQIDPVKLEKLLEGIPPSVFGLVSPIPRPQKVDNPVIPATVAPLTLSEVLFNLGMFFHQLNVGFEDLTQRHFAFKSLRSMVCERLWEAAEAEKMDRYFLQLADQLIAAVQTLETDTLRPLHLKAIQTTLSLFEKPDLTKDDVLRVDRIWAAAEVETLPSFGELLKNWRESYGIEDEVVESREDQQHGQVG